MWDSFVHSIQGIITSCAACDLSIKEQAPLVQAMHSKMLSANMIRNSISTCSSCRSCSASLVL